MSHSQEIPPETVSIEDRTSPLPDTLTHIEADINYSNVYSIASRFQVFQLHYIKFINTIMNVGNLHEEASSMWWIWVLWKGKAIVGSQSTFNIRQSRRASLVSNPFQFEVPSFGNKTTCPQSATTSYINGKVSVNWNAQFGDSFKIEQRLSGGSWLYKGSYDPNYYIDSTPAIGLPNEYRISSNNSSLNCPMVTASISL